MKYRISKIFLILLSLFCLNIAVVHAQQLVVYSVSGSVQRVDAGKRIPLKAWDKLTLETVINIPYDASVDLVDKANNRKYHLKTPGRDNIKAFIASQGNSVAQLTKQYAQYMTNQMQGGAKRSVRRFSDAATVTRSMMKVNTTDSDPWDTDEWEKAFRNFGDSAKSNYDQFSEEAIKEYETFRDEANSQYAAFMQEAWAPFKRHKAEPQPEEKNYEPTLTIPKEELGVELKSRPVVIEDVVLPVLPTPQPLPIAPIVQDELAIVVDTVVVPPVQDTLNSDKPIEEELPVKPVGHEILYYGTKVYVRYAPQSSFRLPSLSSNDIAAAWTALSDTTFNNTIADCLTIRSQLKLGDWAYIKLLETVAGKLLGEGSNEAVMLASYIYCQSGYKMRLGKSDTHLYLLFGSRHKIYGRDYFIIDGENFYPLQSDNEDLHICNLPFPEEQSLSLLLTEELILADNATSNRTLDSGFTSVMKATASVNNNLIKFYDGYPSSEVGENMMSRWAMYANTPMAKSVCETLYPELRAQLSGLSQLDAVNKILAFVQHALTYKYDDEVWGQDRAFFAEETLYYPYADCEDRSILFSRIVRDLLNLKVVLVYYPGHLAAAVHFPDAVNGDYILLDGERFTVCDPTFIGAPVGRTMSNMDNATAKVILLD